MTQARTIAIASLDDRGLQGEVSGHFGRCAFYTMVSIESDEIVEVGIVPNPHAQAHKPGVMPNFINQLGASAIIAGGMGPRAIRLFEELGVEVATGAVGSVGAVLGAYLDGRLGGTVPCSHDHPDSCGGHSHG
jgi:predicted Fe-Mo cluster-binding NifX family protein